MSKVVLFDLGGVVFTDFFSGGETGLAEALNLLPKRTPEQEQTDEIVTVILPVINSK